MPMALRFGQVREALRLMVVTPCWREARARPRSRGVSLPGVVAVCRFAKLASHTPWIAHTCFVQANHFGSPKVLASALVKIIWYGIVPYRFRVIKDALWSNNRPRHLIGIEQSRARSASETLLVLPQSCF